MLEILMQILEKYLYINITLDFKIYEEKICQNIKKKEEYIKKLLT
jgi:hypothetical protein